MPRPGLIPLAQREYDQYNEQTTRNSIEQELQDLSNTVTLNETKKNKDGSLALRRYQFMFLGKGNV